MADKKRKKKRYLLWNGIQQLNYAQDDDLKIYYHTIFAYANYYNNL